MAVLGGVLAGAIALVLALDAGVVGVAAVPTALRTGAVAVALFGVCGYAPTQLLVRGELGRYRPLLVLPLGATISSLALTVLGLLHVPLRVSLVVLIIVALAADVRTAQQTQPARAQLVATARRLALPTLLAILVAMVALIPIFRSGFATVPGQNGDAVLVVASAKLVEHAPPTATRLDMPINRIPLLWRSKYPIYYALAEVSTVANEDPIKAFATVLGVMLALTAIGFFCFARYVLRAPPAVALLAMFLLPLDRIVMYVTIHPYYNELWGQFALPFILLFGWRYLTTPDRRSATLFALFLVLGLLAYPLVVPFPLVFLAVGAWLRRRRLAALGESPGWIAALRLPRMRARPLLWVPALVVAIPVVLVLVRGFVEKTSSAVAVLAPWTSLANWHGKALGYIPGTRFLGLPGSGWLDYLGLAVVCALAAWGLRTVHGDARSALAAMALVTALIGIYFRVRTGGELFFFKDLAFLGPYVLLMALLALGSLASSAARPRAALGLAGIAAALVVVPAGAATEIDHTFAQAGPTVFELQSWDRALARGTSVRIDVPPNGYQLWTTYMFSDHPLSALNPLGGFFPHPRQGRKADFVIAERDQPQPQDAVGQPLFSNAQFQLWRMSPAVPGPDVSSRRLTDISKVTIG